ncbi:MAG: hypothetical protein M0Z54_03955 [Thermaerobacter sp.]|nr:hypothetical protein [Thermaerobacter sp.]
MLLASALPHGRPRLGRWPTTVNTGLGYAAELSATVLWGYANVVMRQVEGTVTPGVRMWLRFLIPLVVVAPALFRVRGAGSWFYGAVAAGAVLGWATYAQATALKTIPVDQCL